MLGLVLTAGGARGAYQAGVLKRLGEVPGLREGPSPFAIIAGASAGAINGTLLAAHGARFGEATREIARLWSSLRVEDVFASDGCSLARAGVALAFDFTLGALLGRTRTHGLLDTAPLGRLLERSFPPRGIADGIRRGRLYAVAVTATSYHTGRSFTFVEGRSGHPVWVKSRRLVLPVSLTSRHVMASSAIPIVFPPVRVVSQAGDLWFGDGGLRLVTPLSPAIRLGASHILSVGVRSSRAADSLAREEAGAVPSPGEGPPRLPCPPLAQVTGVFLNAIFLDHLDADLDHLARMNEIVASGRRDTAGSRASEPIRSVTPLVVSPSEDPQDYDEWDQRPAGRRQQTVLHDAGELGATRSDLEGEGSDRERPRDQQEHTLEQRCASGRESEQGPETHDRPPRDSAVVPHGGEQAEGERQHRQALRLGQHVRRCPRVVHADREQRRERGEVGSRDDSAPDGQHHEGRAAHPEQLEQVDAELAEPEEPPCQPIEPDAPRLADVPPIHVERGAAVHGASAGESERLVGREGKWQVQDRQQRGGGEGKRSHRRDRHCGRSVPASILRRLHDVCVISRGFSVLLTVA